MKVAVWNFPPVDMLTSGLASGETSDRFEVQRLRIPDCERVLLEGHVDVALLPTMSVLRHHDDLDVVPAVALSTWKYPFARLAIGEGLGTSLRTVAYNPEYEQERFLTELVLREHYKIEPEFVPVEGGTTEQLLTREDDARLVVGPDVSTMSIGERTLDIGQEWFELANYPMTWGLFATRKGELEAADIRAVRDGILASERQKRVWMRAQETSRALHAFYVDDMRFRLDDLCVAGLTEFRQYLFYFDVVDDVRDIPFVFLEDDDEDDDAKKPII